MPDGKLYQVPTMVLNQLIKGLETTQQHLQKNSIEMAELRGEVKGLTKEVEKVNRVLRDGNGSSSLLSRMTVIETVFKDATTALNTLKESTKGVPALEKWAAEQSTASKAAIEGKWKLYAAAVPGIIALVATLVVTVWAPATN